MNEHYLEGNDTTEYKTLTPEDKLDFSNFSQLKNDELQKYSIPEIKQYALVNNIEIIEHARPNSIEIELLCRKLPNTPFAECYDIIVECFERIYNEKKWTLGGKIQIYNQNKKSLYKSFVYDITKNLELLKSSAQEECKKRDGVAAFLTQRNVIKYQDLIDKFNSFYEDWCKCTSLIGTNEETNNEIIFDFTDKQLMHISKLYTDYQIKEKCEINLTEFIHYIITGNLSTIFKRGTKSTIRSIIVNIFSTCKNSEWKDKTCSSIGEDYKYVIGHTSKN